MYVKYCDVENEETTEQERDFDAIRDESPFVDEIASIQRILKFLTIRRTAR